MSFFRGRTLKRRHHDSSINQKHQHAMATAGIARACMEVLEERRLLANPVIDPIDDVRVPGGKTLIVPVTAADEDGDRLKYTVTSSNKNIKARLSNSSTWVKISFNVAAGSDATTQPAFSGDMVFQLFGKVAPNTVRSFANLVRAEFYNGLKMHRLANLGTDTDTAWILQGGDPAGTGSGSSPFRIDDEFDPDAIFSGNGQLAMANSGPDTNGTQFFITQSPTRHLDFDHTIFGQLVRGFNFLDQMIAVGINSSGALNRQITIGRAEVIKNKTDAVVIIEAPRGATGTVRVRATDGKNTDAQAFEVRGRADAANTEPFILRPAVDRVVKGGAEYFDVKLQAFDFEGDASLFGMNISGFPNATFRQVKSDLLRVVPNAGYRGPILFDVWVNRGGGSAEQSQAVDSQRVAFMVGEHPITDVERATFNGRVGVDRGGVVATFRDTNRNGQAGDFTATINWGDGTTPTPGTITRDDDGLFRIRGNHTYAVAGRYKTLISIESNLNATGSVRKGVLKRVVGKSAVADGAITGEEKVLVGKVNENLGGGGIVVATFSDADTRDVKEDFIATIDWGDGVIHRSTDLEDQVLITGQSGQFSVAGTHKYADAGTYPITVTLEDRASGESATVTSEAFIARAGFTIGDITAPSVIENTEFTLTDKSFADDEDGHTYTGKVNWGEGDAEDFEDLAIDSAAKTFDLAHTYKNSDVYEITVILTDENGSTTSERFNLTVTNKPPTFTSVIAPATAVRGEPITLKLNGVSDVSEADQAGIFHYEIDWGDGNKQTLQDTSATDRLTSVTHVYMKKVATASQAFTISVRVREASESFVDASRVQTPITVNIAELRDDPTDSAVKHLYVGGYNQTSTATAPNVETIRVVPVEGEPGKVRVIIDDGDDSSATNDFTGTFDLGPSGRIVIFDGAGGTTGNVTAGDSDGLGNDLIKIDPGLNNNVEIYASAGNDTLIASGGDDILSGGLGDDTLKGGGGRDILLGGSANTTQTSRDLLVGGDGEDILVGGTTMYDRNPKAMRRIGDEWNRTDLTYAERIDHITGATTGGLNGSARLRQGIITFDDVRQDVLRGKGGRDLFFYSRPTSPTATGIDILPDREKNERLIEQ
jgi:cyclophilin family peptidyl-prolyl cis-trans isomerase